MYVSMCDICAWYFVCVCVWHQDVPTDIQHGWSDLPAHSFDSAEGKNCFIALVELAAGIYILLYLFGYK